MEVCATVAAFTSHEAQQGEAKGDEAGRTGGGVEFQEAAEGGGCGDGEHRGQRRGEHVAAARQPLVVHHAARAHTEAPRGRKARAQAPCTRAPLMDAEGL